MLLNPHALLLFVARSRQSAQWQSVHSDIRCFLDTCPLFIHESNGYWCCVMSVYVRKEFVTIWRDPFWKYNTQHFCLVVEQVQIKLIKFGLVRQIGSLSWPTLSWHTRRLAGWDPHNSERPFLVKVTKWVCERMINCGEGMRGSNALLSGFGQGLTKYS